MKRVIFMLKGFVCLGSVVLTGCLVGPDYEAPIANMPTAYKNGSGVAKDEGAASRDD